MTDTQIKCFLALADNLNYTKTAQIMGISQSTLSAHIAALEKSMNHALFVRNKRSVVLTVAGEIMYKTFKQTSDMINASIQQIESLERGTRNRIAIGVMEGQWSQCILKRLSAKFMSERRDVSFEIKTFGNAELLEQLDIETVDMIFGYSDVLKVRQDLRSLPIYETPLYIAKRAGNQEQILCEKERLEKQCFVLQNRNRAPYFEKIYETFCQVYNIIPYNIVRVENQPSVMFNVEMGRGIGFVDDLSMIYGKSQFAFEKIKDISIKYDLIYKPGHSKAVLADYIEYIKEYYPVRTSNSNWSAGL